MSRRSITRIDVPPVRRPWRGGLTAWGEPGQQPSGRGLKKKLRQLPHAAARREDRHLLLPSADGFGAAAAGGAVGTAGAVVAERHGNPRAVDDDVAGHLAVRLRLVRTARRTARRHGLDNRAVSDSAAWAVTARAAPPAPRSRGVSSTAAFDETAPITCARCA
jgi:hypothetical protein